MNYNQFTELVIKLINEDLTDSVRARIQSTQKNNGVVKKGILFCEEGNDVSPTIYLEGYYEQLIERKEYRRGRSLDEELHEIVKDIINMYYKVRVEMSDEKKDIFDYEYLRKRITCRLINYEKNKEMLKEMPYQRMMDLAVVFCAVIEGFGNLEEHMASLYIRNEHLEMWDISQEDLMREALDHTIEMFPAELNRVEDLLMGISGLSVPKGKGFLYVLSNKMFRYGAITMIYPDLLGELADGLESDLFIIPSSVHELLIVPCISGFGPEKKEIEEMVKSVNETGVEDEEILSDSVYVYHREHRMLTY